MIFRLMVDPVAVANDGNASVAADLAHCDRFLTIWRKFGILTILEDFSNSQLLDMVDALPQPFKKRWQESLKHQRVKFLNSQILTSTIWMDANQLNSIASLLDVLYIEHRNSDIFSLTGPDLSVKYRQTNLEVCRYEHSDLAATVKIAEKLTGLMVKAGSATSQIWHERFAHLALSSKFITIVDRYCLRRFVAKSRDSGLVQILERLCSDGQKHSLKIYSADVPHDLVSIAKRLRRSVTGIGALQSVEILCASDRHFASLSHDRFIRFDSTVVDLGSGLEVIEGTKVRRNCTFSAKFEISEYLDVERTLAKNSLEVCTVI